jgi:hypothetical protein
MQSTATSAQQQYMRTAQRAMQARQPYRGCGSAALDAGNSTHNSKQRCDSSYSRPTCKNGVTAVNEGGSACPFRCWLTTSSIGQMGMHWQPSSSGQYTSLSSPVWCIPSKITTSLRMRKAASVVFQRKFRQQQPVEHVCIVKAAAIPQLEATAHSTPRSVAQQAHINI